jgi:ribonuclease HII
MVPDGLSAGVDKAGRGCLAGPVIAAAVILPPQADVTHLSGLTDSKLLSVEAREDLAPRIRREALAWGIGLSWPREIERINILQASLMAMARAVAAASRRGPPPTQLEIDGNQPIPPAYLGRLASLTQTTIKGGDLLVPAISAASILAKTFRDQLMQRFDVRHPGYGLAKHKGYATKAHKQAIQDLGPCRLHRMTFRGVKPEPEMLGLPLS